MYFKNKSREMTKIFTAEGPMLSEVADQLTGRYDTIVYDANNEDAYAQQQSGLAQAVNGTLKGLNLAATTVAGGFGVVAGTARWILPGGKLSDIWDNPIMNGLDKYNNEVDNYILPNYYTDAEKNASLDNSKKALVNITYELDNLLLKTEKLLENVSSVNKNTQDYISEIMKEVKMYYNTNNISKISENILEELKYATNVLMVEYIKSQLGKSDSSSGNKKGGGVVIDVTEE
jgi:hypothetical protein